MVPWRVLASSHEHPCHVDGCFPLEKAPDLGHRGLWGNGEEHVHLIRHHVPLFNPTFLLLGQRAKDCPAMASPGVVERLPTILGDKHDMLRAVPLGMAESLIVRHDKLPLGGTLSVSLQGVCFFDSRNCQTVRVPRRCGEFTWIKLYLIHPQKGYINK